MSRSDTAAIYMNVVLRLSRSIKPIIGRERQKNTAKPSSSLSPHSLHLSLPKIATL